jgi:hypothetical protein
MTAPALRKRRRIGSTKRQGYASRRVGFLLLVAAAVSVSVGILLDHYTFSLQSPIRIHFQSPLVISLRSPSEEAAAAEADQ